MVSHRQGSHLSELQDFHNINSAKTPPIVATIIYTRVTLSLLTSTENCAEKSAGSHTPVTGKPHTIMEVLIELTIFLMKFVAGLHRRQIPGLHLDVTMKKLKRSELCLTLNHLTLPVFQR